MIYLYVVAGWLLAGLVFALLLGAVTYAAADRRAERGH